MTNIEGDIVEDEIRTEYAMEISHDNDIFQNLSVFINNLDKHINYTINSAYAYDPGIFHKIWNSNSDKDFSNALSLRGEISKICLSIGSWYVSSEYCDLFQPPSVTTNTNIESNLEVIIVSTTFRQYSHKSLPPKPISQLG